MCPPCSSAGGFLPEAWRQDRRHDQKPDQRTPWIPAATHCTTSSSSSSPIRGGFRPRRHASTSRKQPARNFRQPCATSKTLSARASPTRSAGATRSHVQDPAIRGVQHLYRVSWCAHLSAMASSPLARGDLCNDQHGRTDLVEVPLTLCASGAVLRRQRCAAACCVAQFESGRRRGGLQGSRAALESVPHKPRQQSRTPASSRVRARRLERAAAGRTAPELRAGVRDAV